MNAISKIALGTAAVVSILGFAVPAHAASVNWNAIAQCESTNNWHINTGNGYYGGLQFDHNTWISNGGGKYAYNANGATKSEQIAVAETLYSHRGLSPWGCGSHGLSKTPHSPSKSRTVHHSTPAPVKTSKAVTQAPAVHIPVEPAPPITDPNAPIGYCYEGLYIWYVVQPGDTLYNIARTHGTTYQIILSLPVNSWITNPALIHPGDEIYVPIGCLKY